MASSETASGTTNGRGSTSAKDKLNFDETIKLIEQYNERLRIIRRQQSELMENTDCRRASGVTDHSDREQTNDTTTNSAAM